MIIHISDSHQIPSQNNTKSKISNFEILQETLHATHLLKLLYKMHKYEMDPTRTVEATEQTRDAGRTWDGRTDGRSETNIPPNNFVVRGYNYLSMLGLKLNHISKRGPSSIILYRTLMNSCPAYVNKCYIYVHSKKHIALIQSWVELKI